VALFNGVGDLYARTEYLGRVTYRINQSATRTWGRIMDGDVKVAAIFRQRDRRTLTLHLSNGLRWDCRLIDSSGELVNARHPHRIGEDGTKIDITKL
jgi:hypothetical protein